MSEETPTVPKVTVHYERKQNLGDFNSVTASAFVTIPLEADASQAVISEAISEAFGLVKAGVYDELGIEVTVDDAGVVREKNPIVVTKTVTPAAGGGNPVRNGGFDTKGLRVMNEKDMTEDIPQWLVDECERMGITGVWANQGKFGTFYKEAVKSGESPVNPDPETGKPGIIHKPK